jgi:protein-L-isoaspartate(D-aspartate) O-methyltransferase
MTCLQVALGVLLLVSGMLCISCADNPGGEEPAKYRERRAAMVGVLRRYGVKDDAVLAAMGKVRRHMYIPRAYRFLSDPYGDHPCSIGHGQTISQPYIVAYMTGQMALKSGEKVLEIGTGSGYQAAILSELGVEVYSIEIVSELAEHARTVLEAEGYAKVEVRSGDGYKGWAENAPYDAIIVTCAPANVPTALVEQLREGGRMIVPVGVGVQRLVILRKKDGRVEHEDDIGVRFVPLVHGKKD